MQLHVTRRDSERLRYILIAQRKLAAARKSGVQAELAGGRELIDDAVLLFALLERAARQRCRAARRASRRGEGRDDEDETTTIRTGRASAAAAGAVAGAGAASARAS